MNPAIPHLVAQMPSAKQEMVLAPVHVCKIIMVIRTLVVDLNAYRIQIAIDANLVLTQNVSIHV